MLSAGIAARQAPVVRTLPLASRPALRPHKQTAATKSGVTACIATYAQLEAIEVDLALFPECPFFSVTAIIRPWRLADVVKALNKRGVRGLTVSGVAGIGFQGGKERYAGTEFGDGDLIEKKKVEVVCVREQVNAVCQCVAAASFTGEIGDGKIFISPVADIIRIRTAETGGTAERMSGGMTDIVESGVLSSVGLDHDSDAE